MWGETEISHQFAALLPRCRSGQEWAQPMPAARTLQPGLPHGRLGSFTYAIVCCFSGTLMNTFSSVRLHSDRQWRCQKSAKSPLDCWSESRAAFLLGLTSVVASKDIMCSQLCAFQELVSLISFRSSFPGISFCCMYAKVTELILCETLCLQDSPIWILVALASLN